MIYIFIEAYKKQMIGKFDDKTPEHIENEA
jgi:hypothetical protein